MFDKASIFFRESYEELKKVTWLSRKEVIGSTVVIIVLIFIISLFVSLIDFVFLRIMGLVI